MAGASVGARNAGAGSTLAAGAGSAAGAGIGAVDIEPDAANAGIRPGQCCQVLEQGAEGASPAGFSAGGVSDAGASVGGGVGGAAPGAVGSRWLGRLLTSSDQSNGMSSAVPAVLSGPLEYSLYALPFLVISYPYAVPHGSVVWEVESDGAASASDAGSAPWCRWMDSSTLP